MSRSRINRLGVSPYPIVVVLLLALVGCGGSSGSSGREKGPRAEGNVSAVGAFEFDAQRLGRGSKIAPEPFQDTLALRLQFSDGNAKYRGLLIDVDDLPRDLEGIYPLGGEHTPFLTFLDVDPAGSGPRFEMMEGTLSLEINGNEASGSFVGEALETGFAAAGARLRVNAEFSKVPVTLDGP
ncbi:MAG: hypothetical protein K8J08_03095 [Thermoanaerobaculia bacterium]|nr:hypothetical protein [Thermoanaerobaculia bacterium]